MQALKVSSQTIIQKLAGSIAINIRNEGIVSITVVGASALNQAIKGIIVARRFLKDDGNMDLSVQPTFVPISTEFLRPGEQAVTGIKLIVKKAPLEENVEETPVANQETKGNDILDTKNK